MIETVVISVLGVMVIALGFTTINLLRKNEKQEDILTGYITYLDQFSRIIEFSDEKMKKIDLKLIVSSVVDDFNSIYEAKRGIKIILNNSINQEDYLKKNPLFIGKRGYYFIASSDLFSFFLGDSPMVSE